MTPRARWWARRFPLLLAVLVAWAIGSLGPAVSGAAASNPIVVENQNPGTDAWQLGHPGFQTADDVNKQIKGYASATSVNKGDSLDFHVSVNPAQTYTIDIYRLGWYGGLGGRLMQHVNATLGVQQPVCPTNPSTGLIECNWPVSHTLSVPTSWTTGAYVALLTNSSNYQNYVPFVVRDDSSNADLLLQTSVTTYQAYNNYPNDGLTGKSLYLFNSYGAPTVAGNRRAVKVSYDRPYADTGVGELLPSPDGANFGYEYHFIRWLEQSGYNAAYSTDIDTHANPANLLNHRSFLSVGHDEYWTKAMRDGVEAARDVGKNLAFFGGNDIYWQIRLEPSTVTSTPNRVEVSYKNNAPALDPVQDETMTTKWRDPPPNRPEQQLMGIQSVNGAASHSVDAPYVVQNASNWIYAGTGFNNGDSVPGIVGYEYDRTDTDFAGHTYPSNTIVSHSPVSDGAWTDFAESIISQATSGAWIFDAGTIRWAWGLDKSGTVDSRIQQTTANILDRFSGGKIVVVEDSQPDDAQDFSFTAGGGLAPTSFSLDDDSDPTLSNTTTFESLADGTYSLSETVPSGWDLSTATCDDGSPVSAIDVQVGETVTCTFTNRKRGQVVLVEDSQPSDPQDFAFTADGGLTPTSFSLDDDYDPTLSNARTFAGVVPGSGYSLAETVPSGWDLMSATCDNGSAISNISVSPGQTVTCTFTNRKRGQVVVVEDSQPSDPQDFAFTAGGGLTPTSFSLDDDSDPTLSNTRTFGNLVPGSGYLLSQTVPSGWDLSSATCDDGSSISNVAVSAGETVTCTFTNRKRGQVVLVEDSQPSDPQDFAFTADGGLTPTSFSLDDDYDPTLSNARTFAGVVPGSGYSLAETVPSGWDLMSATCDNGSAISNISVSPGQTVTCTFTNRKRGQVVVVEDSQPSDPQDFAFTAGGGLTPTSFSLDDDSDPTLSNTRTFGNLVPGSGYLLSQTVPSGWDLSSATCDNGSAISNIGVSAGETVTCTFVHKKRGSIVVALTTNPNKDPQTFAFTATGGLSPSSFSLDTHNSPALPSSQTFTSVPAQSGYAIAETVPSGWDVTSATCDNGSDVSDVVVSPGQTVTCTFANRKRGQISIVQDSQPNDPQDFAFTAGGGLSPSSFSLDDDSDPTLSNTRTFANVVPASGYSVAQSPASGWDLSSASCSNGSPVTNITVGVGQTVTCTFTSLKRGSIVVVEDSQPNDPQDFAFTAGGGLSPSSFSLDDDSDPTLSNSRTFTNVAATGTYSIAETVPAGWALASATCDNGNAVGSITITGGQTVTCTFTSVKHGNIVVVEDSQPDDPQDFGFTAGGGLSPSSFSLDDDSDPALSNTRTFANVAATNGYSIAETVPAAWSLASATCDNGSAVSNITVSPGQTVTCTFTNRKRGSIVVVEDSQPNDAQDFGFTAGGGLSPSSFSLDDDSDPTLSNTRTFAGVVPGSGYSLSETVPSGWDLTSSTCDDGSSISNIGLSAGETVTCSFVNRKRGQVVVVEDSQPDDPQNFAFTAGGGLSPSSFSLDDDSDPTLSSARTFSNVVPGSGYSLSETVPSGWELSSATCDDGSPPENIDISAGETATCTFTNTPLAPDPGQIVVVADTRPDDPQDFSFTAGGGLSPVNFSLDDDSDPTLPNTHTFSGVTPGSGYSVAEAAAPGWKQSGTSCDDGSPVSNIDVAAGETVTCTFINVPSYERPASASPLDIALVPSFRGCGTGGNPANSSHSPPLSVGSCPALPTSTVAVVGGQSTGSAALVVVPGDADPGNGDQADVQVTAGISDVQTASGSDYNPNPAGPDMTLAVRLRITDTLSCTGCPGPFNQSATATEFDFLAPIDCGNTPSEAIGATCTADTSADAITPGMISEGSKSIVQAFRIRVNDAGQNGIRGDSDDRLFEQQGFFAE